ncbi:hypothetical protein [Nonomuraea rubra]|uniref:hypothetical protein n=1 Tax=Nonomuraea rubra TaxID=46180 RepID=UPI00360AF7A2
MSARASGDSRGRLLEEVGADFPQESEAPLAVEPDFVYGGWDSVFEDKAGRSRETLARAGTTPSSI